MHELGVKTVSDQAFEVLRIEAGLPLYGIDMDDSTVVPEINLHELINYNKGCYIGQEVIARIHFRGHVAKQLTGLIFEEIWRKSRNRRRNKIFRRQKRRKNNFRHYSPKLEKQIALAFVRYAYLEEGTEVKINDSTAKVKNLPFLK